MLPLQTQSVIALRLMRMAGGAFARSEAGATRMKTEKVQSPGEAQLVSPVEPMTGRNPRRIAKKSMASRNRPIAKEEIIDGTPQPPSHRKESRRRL